MSQDKAENIRNAVIELEKGLKEIYNKDIKWRMFLFYTVKRWFIRTFINAAYEEKKDKFMYTLRGVWDQTKERWLHTDFNSKGPDWKISLPWKKSRGFPQTTHYKKGSIEMEIGYKIVNRVLHEKELDDLMFENNTTDFTIEMYGDKVKTVIIVS